MQPIHSVISHNTQSKSYDPPHRALPKTSAPKNVSADARPPTHTHNNSTLCQHQNIPPKPGFFSNTPLFSTQTTFFLFNRVNPSSSIKCHDMVLLYIQKSFFKSRSLNHPPASPRHHLMHQNPLHAGADAAEMHLAGFLHPRPFYVPTNSSHSSNIHPMYLSLSLPAAMHIYFQLNLELCKITHGIIS